MRLPAPPAATAAADGTGIYVPLDDDHLVAVDRSSGSIAWTRDARQPGPAIIHDGTLFVASADGLLAVATRDGAPRFTAATGAQAVEALAGARDLVIAAASNSLVALDTRDGRIRWTHQLPPAQGAVSTLAVGRELVYVARGDRVAAIRLADGTLGWTRDLGGRLGHVAASGQRVFVGSTDNHLHALRADSGKVAWRWRYGGDVVGTAIADDRVYVAALDNVLRALRPGNGHQQWKSDLATRPGAPPLVVGQEILVSGNDPTLATFEARTGRPVATYRTSIDLAGPPVVSPGLDSAAIVLVGRDGQVIGLRPTPPATAPAPGTPGPSPPAVTR